MSEAIEKDGIINAPIKREMEESYLSYAMSVIVSRAIPDAKDGLKPVHRRILYAMSEIGCEYNRPHKKSARIVGEVIGKYHPHGDQSIYDALVRMAQDFSMGVPLINGQGNFGSIDADPAASMRYTEARFMKITSTMFDDIDKETVEFQDNYDGSETEPSVLPVTFPNLLVNGAEGIAVGMATSIPPHNLTEVINAALAIIENPEISDDDLVSIIPAPDFPTGGIILDKRIARQAVLTGRGSIPIRSKTEVEEMKNGKEAIIVTEIPYQVIKSSLLEKIAELIKDKKISGISAIRDESNQKGMRIVIEVKKDTSTQVVLNHLYKLTPLQSSFAVNLLALNNKKPELLNIRKALEIFIQFRKQIIVNRTNFLLKASRLKAHQLIGFYVAVDEIDRVITLIRSSENQAKAREKLLNESWEAKNIILELIDLVSDYNNKIVNGKFKFTEVQVKAILEMRLSKLTGLEREALKDEISFHAKEIAEFISIINDEERIRFIISDELKKIRDEYPVKRRTQILDYFEGNKNEEDFIEKEDIAISITQGGYIKRTKLDLYSPQNRGGKGKSGMSILDGDEILHLFTTNTHASILFFTDKGIVYKIKGYQIPETLPNARGRQIINLIPKLKENEKVDNVIAISLEKSEWDNYDIIFATKKGNIRRSSIFDFENINSNGKIAISLDADDKLISVKLAQKDRNIFIATQNGNAIRFPIDSLRVIKSRNSDGVRGINLDEDDCVVSMSILPHNEENFEIKQEYLKLSDDLRIKIKYEALDNLEIRADFEAEKLGKNISLEFDTAIILSKEESFVLSITENGYGKKTSSFEYRITNRGGKGIINMNTEKSGKVIISTPVEKDQDIILISNNGQIIRINESQVSIIGRNTKGVKLFNLEGDKVVSVSLS